MTLSIIIIISKLLQLQLLLINSAVPVSVIACRSSSLSQQSPLLAGSSRRMPLLIDGHNDFPMLIRAYYHNHIYQRNFSDDRRALFGQVDFPRLRRGGLGAQFWSVYVECPPPEAGYDDDAYCEIIHDTLQQIDLVHRLIEAYPAHLQLASSSHDITSRHGGDGPIQSLLGVEGLHQIGNSASVLRMYHRLGVRYTTLTHTCHNRYADSERPKTALHRGLSPAGLEMVTEMNRIGMMVDLSHTSVETQADALAHTRAPVIYSHSSTFALCNHTRNVHDEIFLRLKDNDGIVMITFVPDFVNCRDPSQASLADVVDHIMHVGNLIGFRHVGIGSDFDGMPNGPRGLEDVSKYPDLFDALHRRGVSAHDIEMLAGGNLVRVLKRVEDVARAMAQERPLEDDVKPVLYQR